MTHTPGPWTVSEGTSRGQWVVEAEALDVSPHHKVLCCTQSPVGQSSPTAFSNALLIASAPDLARALKNTLEALLWFQESRIHPPTTVPETVAEAQIVLKAAGVL